MSSTTTIDNLLNASTKYRELAAGILLQYADSEMAGGAGYSSLLALAPGISERVQISRIAYEKLSLAQKTYELIAETGINIEKYASSHCWEARLHRNQSLGFRRASADKRVNALMFPVQGWEDLAVFTCLMAGMACFQLQEFSKSSLRPWAELAATHISVEESQRNFGLISIEKLVSVPAQKEVLKQSLNYWEPRVLACFGPANSARNLEYIDAGLKTKRNEDLASEWQEWLNSALDKLSLKR